MNSDELRKRLGLPKAGRVIEISAEEYAKAGDAKTALRIREGLEAKKKRKRDSKYDGASEAEVVGEIETLLLRYRFVEPRNEQPDTIGHYLKTPAFYGDFRGTHKPSGGIPDLLVRHWKWPRGFWLGLEVKGRKHAVTLTDSQKSLQAAGCLVVVTSADEAWKAVCELSPTTL